MPLNGYSEEPTAENLALSARRVGNPGLGMAQPQQQPLINPRENPLGAAGLVLGDVAAGLRGQPLRSDKLVQQRQQEQQMSMEQQQLQMRSAELGLQIAEKYATVLDHTKPEEHDAVFKDMARYDDATGGMQLRPLTEMIAQYKGAQRQQVLEAADALGVGKDPRITRFVADNPGILIDFIKHEITKDPAKRTSEFINVGDITKQGIKDESGNIVEWAKDPNTGQEISAPRYKPVGATLTVDQRGENALATSVGQEIGKDLTTERKKGKASEASVVTINEAAPLLDKGIFSGPFANWKLQGAKVLGVAPETVANTEAFGALMTQQTGQEIQAFGSGTALSDGDRIYAARAAGGDITFNEESLKRLARIKRRAARLNIDKYNDYVNTQIASTKGGEAATKLLIKQPPISKSEQRDNFLDEARGAIEQGAPRAAVLQEFKRRHPDIPPEL